MNALTCDIMEVAFRLILRRTVLKSQILRRTAPCLVSVPAYARPITHRHFSSTPRRTADPNHGPFFGLGAGGSPPMGTPTTYFSSRPSLPANTIIRFVPQQTAWIVERMGKFNRILEPGLAILVPFLDRIAYVKSLKEAAIEIPSQNAITADNVTLELDGVLYTRVFDAYKARLVITELILGRGNILICYL